MKAKLVLVVILVSALHGKAQIRMETSSRRGSEDPKTATMVTGGVSYQRQFVGELGVIYGSVIRRNNYAFVLAAFKLASEFNFRSDAFFIGPKLALETDAAFLGLRANIIDYTDFTYHNFKLTPEIGWNYRCMFTLFYGYNISLTKNRVKDVGTNRITLTVNYHKLIWGH